MDLKQYKKIYLEEISAESARWQDSLGGKMVTGIGSLLNLGAKGIATGAKKSYQGVKGYIKQKKTKQKIQQLISNINNIYNPYQLYNNQQGITVINNLVNNKAEIQYMLSLAKDVIPPNLLRFLEIFKNTGAELLTLFSSNQQILKDDAKINSLIKQSLLQRIQNFKDTTTIASENVNFTDMYLALIHESKKTNIQQYLVTTLAFTKAANEFEKVLNGIQIAAELDKDSAFSAMKPVYENDEIKLIAKVDKNIVSLKISSKISKNIKQAQLQVINVADIKNQIIEQIKEFYTSELKAPGVDPAKQAAIYKMQNLIKVFQQANYIILNDIKWTGWFGSLKKILREISECKLKIQQVQFLALVYFHVSLIK